MVFEQLNISKFLKQKANMLTIILLFGDYSAKKEIWYLKRQISDLLIAL